MLDTKLNYCNSKLKNVGVDVLLQCLLALRVYSSDVWLPL